MEGRTERSWFDLQLDRKQRTRPHVRAGEKTFLQFMYANTVTVLENEGIDFELEHLFPVTRLKSLIPENDGWPISCIANLALFEKSLNREKSKQTISEYLRKLDEQADTDEKRAEAESTRVMVERYLLSDVDDVSIPDEGGEDALTKEHTCLSSRSGGCECERSLARASASAELSDS